MTSEQLWNGLATDVYERLCDCRSKRSDILPLAICVCRNRGYSAEQSIEYTLEHLSCNSQDFEVTADEWADLEKKILKAVATPQKSPAQKVYDSLGYVADLDDVLADIDDLECEIKSGIVSAPGLPKKLGDIAEVISRVRNGLADMQ